MPNDAHLILLFLEEQERLGKSSGTINNRRIHLNHFLEALGSFDVTPRRIQTWLDSTDLKVSTRRTYLWHYSEFYKWAIRHGYLDDNPAVGIIPPEEPTLPPVLTFTASDIQQAIDAAAEATASGARPGDIGCWVALAAFQGMACREIAELTYADVNIERQVIHFRYESPLPRSEILHPAAASALAGLSPLPNGPLFPDADAQKVSKALAKYLRDCGIDTSAKGLVQWHGLQVESLGKHFGRGPESDSKFDDTGIDPALWEHVARYATAGDWGAVALHAERFTEDRVRHWAKLPMGVVGETLMTRAFGESGKFHLGVVDSERQGWHRLAMGISMALRNVDAHRIQDERSDLKLYAIGVVGACSLLITQLRYQYGDQID